MTKKFHQKTHEDTKALRDTMWEQMFLTFGYYSVWMVSTSLYCSETLFIVNIPTKAIPLLNVLGLFYKAVTILGVTIGHFIQ